MLIFAKGNYLARRDVNLLGCSLKSIDEKGYDLSNDSVFADLFDTIIKYAFLAHLYPISRKL